MSKKLKPAPKFASEAEGVEGKLRQIKRLSARGQSVDYRFTTEISPSVTFPNRQVVRIPIGTSLRSGDSVQPIVSVMLSHNGYNPIR